MTTNLKYYESVASTYQHKAAYQYEMARYMAERKYHPSTIIAVQAEAKYNALQAMYWLEYCNIAKHLNSVEERIESHV